MDEWDDKEFMRDLRAKGFTYRQIADQYNDSPYYADGGVRLHDHPYYCSGGVSITKHPHSYADPLPTLDSRRKQLLIWKCEYCDNENVVDALVCRGCGASRVAANVRAFWILE